MRFLTPLAAIFGIEVQAFTDSIKRQIVFGSLIGSLVAIAAVFFLLAGFIALADVFGGLIAALIMAGGALLLALAFYLGSQVGATERRLLEKERRRKSEANALAATAAVSAIPALMKSRLALPAAAIAAYLLFRPRKD